MTPRPFVASDFRPFFLKFHNAHARASITLCMLTTMMASLRNNPSIFASNVANAYSPIMVSGLAISNHGRTIQPCVGIGFRSQVTPALTTNFVMVMRQQVDTSNHDMVNTLTQQMGAIFNPLIQNTNQSYQQQMLPQLVEQEISREEKCPPIMIVSQNQDADQVVHQVRQGNLLGENKLAAIVERIMALNRVNIGLQRPN